MISEREANPLIVAEREKTRLNELYRQKKQLVEHMKNLTRQQRVLSDSHKQHSLQGERLTKMVKTNDETPQIRSQQSITEHHQHLKIEEEEIKKIVDVQSSIKDRNKRLFGGLTNHLKKASSKIQQESEKVKQKLSIQEKAVQRQLEQTLVFEEKRLKDISQNLQNLTAKKMKNAKQILLAENIILKNKFFAYVSDLSHFLLTKTQPTIAWKYNNETEQLKKIHQLSQKHQNDQNEKTVEIINSYNQLFDFNKYLVENEQQYYRNYLQNYFTNKQNFILTKTKPNICWIPSAMNSKLQEIRDESKIMLIEKLKAISTDNENHYKRFQKQVVASEHSEQESQSQHEN